MEKKILSEWKAERAEITLRGSFGIHLKTKDGHLMGSSHSLKTVAISIDTPDRLIKIIGVSGSSTDLSEAVHKLSAFESRIMEILSNRDINSELIRNFLARYIKNSFYHKDDESPQALEFLITEYAMNFEIDPKTEKLEKSLSFSTITIDYRGEFDMLTAENFIVIGRPFTSEWKKKMSAVKWNDLELQEAKGRAAEILGDKIRWLPVSKFIPIDEEDDEPTKE